MTSRHTDIRLPHKVSPCMRNDTPQCSGIL